MAAGTSLSEFYKTTDSFFARHDVRGATEYMIKALEEARADNNTEVIIAAANELGGMSRSAGKLDEAKALYAEVLRKLQEIGQVNNDNYAMALINYGNVYMACREFDEAIRLYREAEGIYKRMGAVNDMRMATLCNNLSALYRETGKFDEAEQTAQRSIDILAAFPEKKNELATSLINLGDVQTKARKYEQADVTLQRAIDIFEKDLGGHSTHYAHCMAAKAQLEFLKGNKQNAVNCYEKALQLIERDFGRTKWYELVESNMNYVKQQM